MLSFQRFYECPIDAGDDVDVFASNGVSGAIDAAGDVSVITRKELSGTIDAGGNVIATAIDDVTSPITASGTADLLSVRQVTGDVTADLGISIEGLESVQNTLTSLLGPVSIFSGTAITTTVTAGGKVDATAYGTMELTVTKSTDTSFWSLEPRYTLMDYSYLHEVELVELVAATPRSVVALVPVLKSCGFTFHDDVVSLDRNGRIPPWQHSSVVEVEIQRDGKEVFGFERGQWDSIQLKYLFASLPFDLVDEFLKAVIAVADQLGITPTRHGRNVTADDLKKAFSEVREELIRETGDDAGSEGLAIFIHSTYPRR